MEKFTLRKLNELKVRKQNQIKISKSLAAMRNSSDSEEINRAWENIKENINPYGTNVIYIYIYIYIYDISNLRVNDLTPILLTWRKW